MSQPSELRFEAATGLSLGARDSQEDAVLCDVPQGGGAGIAVLADGLGGHAAGATASRIAVSTVLSALAGQRDASGAIPGDVPGLLQAAARAAHYAILAHAERHPETAGMGATLVAIVVQSGALHWLSIGDSPLYLLRDGATRQLNRVHTLAPQFDYLARMGEMDPAVAACHPDRSCLTSALGCDPLRLVDCPDTPFPLRPDDLLLAASDGILTLSEAEIAASLRASNASVAEQASRLITRVAGARDNAQDNLSLALLRAAPADTAAPARGRLRRLAARLARPDSHAPGGLAAACRALVPLLERAE